MNVLLVPAHPGFPGQIPQSRKTVVLCCVCVCVDECFTSSSRSWINGCKTSHSCSVKSFIRLTGKRYLIIDIVAVVIIHRMPMPGPHLLMAMSVARRRSHCLRVDHRRLTQRAARTVNRPKWRRLTRERTRTAVN